MRVSLGFLLLLLISVTVAAAGDPWPRHTIDDSSRGADGVRLADVNGDGLMDIATGWEEGGVVRAYLHPGLDKAKAKWPATTVGKVKSPEDAVFADLDGDGVYEVISSCEGKTRSTFVHWPPAKDGEGWRTEAFPATKDKQQWMYALPMDIDGENGVDLILSSKGKGASVGWLQSPQDPRDLAAWRWHKLQDAGWIMSLIAADMDGDGDDDVLVSDRRGAKRGVYWLERPGWERHDIGGSDREIKFISRGDVDGDGRADVVASEKSSLIWYRSKVDGWEEHIIPLPKGVGGGKSTAICDVDGDGDNDIVFSCEGAAGALSGMRWLSRNDDGGWADHEVAGEPGHKYDRVVPYDVDQDGDLDMLCCEERDGLGVFWYENTLKSNP